MKYGESDLKIMLKSAFDVINGKIEQDYVINRIVDEYGYNRNSVNDYINGIKCMIDGNKYVRTINLMGTRIAYDGIILEYGIVKLKNALDATKLHIEYYEKVSKSNMVSLKILQQEYYEKYFINEINNNENTIKVEDISELIEGNQRIVEIKEYERSLKARDKCLDIYGYDCSICGINMEKIYGERAKEFIHVHHVKPLSEINKEYEVDPENDLVPVCPNCHAIIHRGKSTISVDEIKSIMAGLR